MDTNAVLYVTFNLQLATLRQSLRLRTKTRNPKKFISIMKYFVAVLLIAVTVFAATEWKIQTAENIATYRPECATSLSIPEDKVNEYKKWNFPNDEKTQCYMKCVFEKMGLFDEKDGFNIERLVKQLGQGKNETVIRPEIVKCADKNPQKTNACQWAYRGFDCFKKANLELVKASVKPT